jgi:hypothetical protein
MENVISKQKMTGYEEGGNLQENIMLYKYSTCEWYRKMLSNSKI